MNKDLNVKALATKRAAVAAAAGPDAARIFARNEARLRALTAQTRAAQ